MITLYGIPNCDTVKKARAWLNERGVAHEFHDFKKHGVPEARLAHWTAHTGWDKLVNRKGTTWRQLDPALQATPYRRSQRPRADAAPRQPHQTPGGGMERRRRDGGFCARRLGGTLLTGLAHALP